MQLARFLGRFWGCLSACRLERRKSGGRRLRSG
nr:MAG TPA: hypothetical protein [Caudoviricetes sp.]